FARLTNTTAADPSPLAPAQYAAQVRCEVPLIGDPGYVPALERLCEQHRVGAVLPLTDLDIVVLAEARAHGRLPAFVPSPAVARATYDKYEAHLLLGRLSLPSPPTALTGPATIQVFRDPELGLRITDVNTRFGGAFPAPTYAALPGRTYPELIVAMASGETVEPHVGEFREGTTFTRYYWQLELDERL